MSSCMQVINAPVLGKVAQTGVERIVGTIVGGICGYAVFRIGENHWGPVSDGILLSLAAMLVAASSVIIAHKLSLDNSAKLFALTFCLVTFGSTNADGAANLMISTFSMRKSCLKKPCTGFDLHVKVQHHRYLDLMKVCAAAISCIGHRSSNCSSGNAHIPIGFRGSQHLIASNVNLICCLLEAFLHSLASWKYQQM